MLFIQRPPQCEAMLVTTTNAAEVAGWCGGQALPNDGGVLFKVNGQWQQLPAAPGEYLARDLTTGILSRIPAADFERQWAPDGGAA